MKPLITNYRKGFSTGWQEIVSEDHFGIDFGILKLNKGEDFEFTPGKEAALVIMSGNAEVHSDGDIFSFKRNSLFDEAPTALASSSDRHLKIFANSCDTEFSIVRAKNPVSYGTRYFGEDHVSPEYRGQGMLKNTCLRNVRLIFDKTILEGSNIVIGEVINYPGRWSSYPPHHHDQPEVYHYRFTEPQGYGHGEMGEEVYKIKNNDTLLIEGGKDHSQVSAPGYGMYYLWAVRHLEGNPYTGFTFTEEHEWMLKDPTKGWNPKDIDL